MFKSCTSLNFLLFGAQHYNLLGSQEEHHALYSKHPTPRSLVEDANFRERFYLPGLRERRGGLHFLLLHFLKLPARGRATQEPNPKGNSFLAAQRKGTTRSVLLATLFPGINRDSLRGLMVERTKASRLSTQGDFERL